MLVRPLAGIPSQPAGLAGGRACRDQRHGLGTRCAGGPPHRHVARRRAVRGPAAGLPDACSTPDHESGTVAGAGIRPRWPGTHASPDRAGVPCAADRSSASDPGRIRQRRHGIAECRPGHSATHGWSRGRRRRLQPSRCDPDLLLDSAVDVVELPVVVCRPLGHVRRRPAGLLAPGSAWAAASGRVSRSWPTGGWSHS